MTERSLVVRRRTPNPSQGSNPSVFPVPGEVDAEWGRSKREHPSGGGDAQDVLVLVPGCHPGQFLGQSQLKCFRSLGGGEHLHKF